MKTRLVGGHEPAVRATLCCRTAKSGSVDNSGVWEALGDDQVVVPSSAIWSELMIGFGQV